MGGPAADRLLRCEVRPTREWGNAGPRHHVPVTSPLHHSKSDRHQAFNELAGAYSTAQPDYPEALWAALRDALADKPVPQVAADVGSGTGISTRQLAAALPHWHIIGVEPGDAMRAQAAEDSRGTAIEFVHGSAEEMPLEAASVGLVVAAQVLHWLDHSRFYAEARRVLAPGGTIGIVQINRSWPDSPLLEDYENFLEEHSPGYSRDYCQFDVVAELAAAGFDHVRHMPSEWILSMTHELFVNMARSSTKLQAAVDALGDAHVEGVLRALLEQHHPSGKFEVPYISDLCTGQHRGNPL